MKEYFNQLINTTLFEGISKTDLLSLLKLLSTNKKYYQKGATIYEIGDYINQIGFILSGSVTLLKCDYWGNQKILSHVEHNEIFGEVYACIKKEPLNISVIANQDSEILFFDIGSLNTEVISKHLYANKFIFNLLQEIAKKTYLLTRKIEHTTQHTTREKLLSYLSDQSLKKRSNSFDIPFNRQELADYLSVDRSAMSFELSKMKNEGILNFHKNKFILNQS